MNRFEWRNQYQEFAMNIALDEAANAAIAGEVPVGAVIIRDKEVIARAHNLRQKNQDPTAHAEILAIQIAAKRLADWRLIGCDLYVTLEPCPMCAGAIVNSRLRGLFFGASDPKAGSISTLYGIVSDPRLNHEAHAHGGYKEKESADLLRDFFEPRRR